MPEFYVILATTLNGKFYLHPHFKEAQGDKQLTRCPWLMMAEPGELPWQSMPYSPTTLPSLVNYLQWCH